MNGSPVALLLERLCVLLRHDARQRGKPHGLQPVQVETLLYLARCNRYSDTPQAVGEFLGSTKGTVSQTLKVLERDGLLTKAPDHNDRRVVRLRLTASGAALASELAVSPLLEQALGADELATQRLGADLTELLRSMQRAAGARAFGACSSCRHLQREHEGLRCGITKERLTPEDSTLICREHEFVEPARATRDTS